MSDVWGLVSFNKYVEYGQVYEKRAIDFYTATGGTETGAERSDAILSMFLLASAQLSLIFVIGMIIFLFIPSNKVQYGLLAFVIALAFVSYLQFIATGDWTPYLIKPLLWAFNPGLIPAVEAVA